MISEQAKPQDEPGENEPALRPSADERKIQIEEAKLQIERQKLQLEWLKIKLTVLSILVPAIVGVGLIFFNGRNAQQSAQRAFELEAAKVLMQSESPEEVRGKAQTFSLMFPGHLPASFGANFNPEFFQNYEPGVRQSKKELFRVLAPRYKTPAEAATLYARLCPDETDWINDTFDLKLPLPEAHENRMR